MLKLSTQNRWHTHTLFRRRKKQKNKGNKGAKGKKTTDTYYVLHRKGLFYLI